VALPEAKMYCTDCGHPLTAQDRACPNCQSGNRSIEVSESIRVMEELGMEARNEAGELQREMATRTDGKKEGIIDFDWTQPDVAVRRSGSRSERLNNIDDENAAAQALAVALNMRDGSRYRHEPKEKEDSKFPDIWMVNDALPLGDSGLRVGVQITHLDREAIGALGSEKHFNLAGNLQALANAIVEAIKAKQHIDPTAAAKTFLLLICPYPIRESMHKVIRDSVAGSLPDTRYREVWIAPFKEMAFRVA
jgi:hypothetical protein